MKMKQLMLMTLVGFCCAVDADIEETYRATKGKKWNLEVKNKQFGHRIYVTIQNGNKLVINRQRVAGSKGDAEKDHGYLRVSDLNLGLPVLITLEDEYALPRIKGYMIERGAKDRTIFVTYENGELRTQSGKGFFSKETQSGLSLKNNISDKDIEPLGEKEALGNLKEINEKSKQKKQETEKERQSLNKKNEEEAHQRALDLEKELQEEREKEEKKGSEEIEGKNNKPAKKLSTAEQILRGDEKLSPEELRELAVQGSKKPVVKKPVVELDISDIDILRSTIPVMSVQGLEQARKDVKAQKYSTDKKTNDTLIEQIDAQIVKQSRNPNSRNREITKKTHKFVEPL